jgi:hypothetical protein
MIYLAQFQITRTTGNGRLRTETLTIRTIQGNEDAALVRSWIDLTEALAHDGLHSITLLSIDPDE